MTEGLQMQTKEKHVSEEIVLKAAAVRSVVVVLRQGLGEERSNGERRCGHQLVLRRHGRLSEVELTILKQPEPNLFFHISLFSFL